MSELLVMVGHSKRTSAAGSECSGRIMHGITR